MEFAAGGNLNWLAQTVLLSDLCFLLLKGFLTAQYLQGMGTGFVAPFRFHW